MSPPPEKPRVLDVGQCDFDHGNISRTLATRFGVEVDRCHTVDEALQAVKGKKYQLVLVNRVFDRNGEEGLKLIERLRATGGASDGRPTVMLVSNFADAQEAAMKSGAVKGFGKAALESEETQRTLEDVLGSTRNRAAMNPRG